MRILDKAIYVGPSLYAHFPVIRLDVDLGELEQWPSGKLGPAFNDGLIAALPGLQEHGCSYGKPGGFIRRLTEDEGTWMGHILEHVAIEMQNVAGEPVTFGKTRSHGTTGQYHVIYQYEQEDVGLEAGRLGVMLLHSLLPPNLRPEGAVPPDFDFAAERDEFIRFAQRRALGPSTVSLVRAAEERKIPWIRLNEQSMIQFGHGRFQQRIQATVTSRTPHIAVELASDKEETNRILANLGLPVPRQRLVQRADDAVAAAERIGYPVVVKPFNANHGRGITIHITAAERSAEGVRGRAGAQPQRHRGELHHRRGPPDAGHQRPAHRGGEAGAGARRGRRRLHDRAAGREGERGSPPRHRPREGAHPARLRSSGRDDAGAEGLHAADACRRRASRSSSAPPATSPPAAPPPISPTWSTPTTPRWRCGR